jgi:FKBP-type peptidyl-prolyl cis-trans isomerase
MRLAILLCLSITACGGERKAAPAPSGSGPSGSGSAMTFAPQLGVDMASMTKTPSGLAYKDLKVGDGAEAKAGQMATVHYTGWLPNGTKFDSSRDRGDPFAFPIGAGQVIKGWDEGVAGMHVGGRRLLVIPASLGYGESGSDPIPPNSTLVFDVELLGVK